ncbi:Degenerin unc-8 [Aphelenchoides fujianensis]|nr:Degenerin unc-8 [Aphelenchoides fujianensis]
MQPTTIAKMRAALEIVGAQLTDEQRDQMCYTLPQLVTNCLINGVPCDMDNDFDQVFDVDYGYCYTFNYQVPNGTYSTSRMGVIAGLQLVLFNNVSDYLPSTEYVGFKVVIHPQDYSPFPNTEGYMSAVGSAARLAASENYYTRLGRPYGYCDTLDSVQDRNQPFYFNGSYSTEGCFRSCFQDRIVAACGCADARFPYSGSNIICNPINQTQYECYLNYIEENGDYYNVNCTCYYPCEDTIYTADVSDGNWPAGTFFNELYCPLAASMNESCADYYNANGAQVSIYYKSLVYTSLEESPTTSLLDVFNNMAGNTGLWIGFTSITIGEIVLVIAQTFFWVFRFKKELPEVPSCRRRNFPKSDEEEDEEPTDVSGPGGELPLSDGKIHPTGDPKTMPNSFLEQRSREHPQGDDPRIRPHLERVSRMGDDYVPPVIAYSGDASSRTVVL